MTHIPQTTGNQGLGFGRKPIYKAVQKKKNKSWSQLLILPNKNKQNIHLYSVGENTGVCNMVYYLEPWTVIPSKKNSSETYLLLLILLFSDATCLMSSGSQMEQDIKKQYSAIHVMYHFSSQLK